jgi:Uma2 family endonuclease
MKCTPELRVHSDYDRYFERLVDSWIMRKRDEGGTFKHAYVVVTAGPYRPDAVTTRSQDDALHIDFYSALRTGFGSLSESDVQAIMELL